jgi:hypothetical protein
MVGHRRLTPDSTMDQIPPSAVTGAAMDAIVPRR